MVQNWVTAVVLLLAVGEGVLSSTLPLANQEPQLRYPSPALLRQAPAWTSYNEDTGAPLADYTPSDLQRSSSGSSSDSHPEDSSDDRQEEMAFLDRYLNSKPSPLRESDYVNVLNALAASGEGSDSLQGADVALYKRAGSLSVGGAATNSLVGASAPSRSLLMGKGPGMRGQGRGLSLSIDASMQVLRQALLFKSALLRQRQQLSRARQNQEFLQTIGKRSVRSPKINIY
ncbi:uncharacterized protein LOC108678823 [Hyalella azteca]|uniref:Uncharacterized protein LOC108678823 n=1 Tax=Hyalella azteca TaxID=294128 RepID=A0A8B7PAM5_HYAAZ|nr:uncharacterized protein LOC108678823 [Hyalella azteca]